MNSFNFLETKREFKLYICGCICIMGKLDMIVEPVIFFAESECSMPFHPFCFPIPEPVELGARLYEILHLHLFELTHSENELPGDDLIPESLAYLCNPEW